MKDGVNNFEGVGKSKANEDKDLLVIFTGDEEDARVLLMYELPVDLAGDLDGDLAGEAEGDLAGEVEADLAGEAMGDDFDGDAPEDGCLTGDFAGAFFLPTIFTTNCNPRQGAEETGKKDGR